MKKYLKTVWFFLSFTLLFINLAFPAASGTSSIALDHRTVSYSRGSTAVQLVWADLNTPGIKVQPVIANGKLLTAAPLSSIAERARAPETEVLAAINGNFFDPAGAGYGGSNVTYGILQIDGEYIKTGGSTIVMGFSADNKVKIGEPELAIELSREGDAALYRPPLGIWAINHTFNNDDEKCIYTSYFGSSTPPASKTSIVVRNGLVAEVINGPGPIYSDGFTLASPCDLTNYAVGDKLEYSITYTDPSWDEYTTKIAGGPILVENGGVRTDYMEQGYSEGNVLVNSGARSFIGVTADNKLFIGTVPGVTVAQLAEIASNLGAVNAMNLDGGASSGMYYEGRYITSPGRDLAVAVAITYSTPVEPPPAPAYVSPFDGASEWAIPELEEAVGHALVPDGMAGKWPQPTNRLLAADAIVKLVEVVYDKTIDEIAAENGFDMSNSFDDTDSKAATFLKAAGISNGIGSNRYDPNGNFTRAAMMTMLGRLAENVFGADLSGAPPGSETFYDIPNWPDAEKCIGWAVYAGIAQGVGDGWFDSIGLLQNQHTGVFASRAYRYFMNNRGAI